MNNMFHHFRFNAASNIPRTSSIIQFRSILQRNPATMKLPSTALEVLKDSI